MSKKKSIDVLIHNLVPRHILMTKTEVQELLDKYQIRIINLPQILDKDPIAVAIGAKEGDVVKIIRKSKTTVTSANYYRYVKKEKV